MTAYYNENDPYAAEWLRRLITAGAIAPGVVDDRSIKDVRPGDLAGFTQCHFFAGIGGWSYALRLARWPDDRPVWTGSCPCQPFSAAGTGASVNDERHLWPAWFSLIAERRPRVIFGEQVEAAIGWGWLDLVFTNLEAESYACASAVLPACSVGAPHIRNRLWFVAHSPLRGRREFGNAAQPGSGGHADGGVFADELANPLQPTGGGRTGGVPRAQTQSGGERFENGNLFDRLGNGGEDGVADATGPGRQPRRRMGTEGGRETPRLESGRLRNADGLGNAEREGLEGLAGHGEDRSEPGRQRAGEGRPTAEAGASHWRDLEWLPCTDGKARPIKPGIQPLAHGVPNRVGKLRAAGNAIVPQAAAEFIMAFQEGEL